MMNNYKNFVEIIDSNPFDFIPAKRQTYFDYLVETEKNKLEVIGKNKAGSLICLYNGQDNKKPSPVIWLDSERSPSGIFTDTLEMFFSILPYGMGLIHRILLQAIDINNNFKNTANCEKLQNEYQKILDRNRKILPVYEKIMNIKIELEPCENIFKSISKHMIITERIIKKNNDL